MTRVSLYLITTALTIIICLSGCDSNDSNNSDPKSEKEICVTIDTTISKAITMTTTTTTTTIISSTTTTEPSQVIEYYNRIKNLNTYECDVNVLGSYSYNGINIPQKDISKKGKIEQKAFYDGLAMCLDFFELGNSWEKYSKHIIGYTPDSKEDFAGLVDELKEFIINDDSFYNIFEALYIKFKRTESIEITNNDNTYNITIKDVKKSSHDLNISEEMFAYIIGVFHDGGAEIDLDTNKCIIVWKDYFNKLSLY